MFWQNLITTPKWALAPINLTGDLVIPEQAPMVFSTSQLFLALITGVIMAFAFQLLLTNLSLGLRFLVMESGDYSQDTLDANGADNADTWGNAIRKIEAKVGLLLIFTATIALFIACFLAVKLSLIESAFFGAIVGVVIWSSYFSIVVWLGSSALGSLIGSISSTVASGIQGLLSQATSVFGASAAQKQIVTTSEEITAAVRRELTSGFDGESVVNTLQNYLSSSQLPKLDIKEIRNQFDQILKNVDLQGIDNQQLLENINRQDFVDLISSRTDLSPQEVNQIADQFEAAWRQLLSGQNATTKLVNLLKSTSPEELNSEKLGEKLQQLIKVDGGNGKQKKGVINRAIQYSLSAAGTAVLDRVNLSDVNLSEVTSELKKLGSRVEDIDVNKIIEQLKSLANQTSEQAGRVGNQVVERLSSQPSSNIKADVEEYLLNSFPWHFNRETLQDEFPEVIYDPNADPRTVWRDLNQIDRDYFANLLKQRGDLKETSIAEITDQLERIRQEVLQSIEQAQTQDRSPLEQSGAEMVPQKIQEQYQEQYEQTTTAIAEYLRNTNLEELNPEGIQRDLEKLFSQPQAGVSAWRDRLQQVDRETLVKLLSQREDLSEEQVNQIIDSTQQAITNIITAPRRLAERTTKQVRDFGANLEKYLRQTNKEELNPEGIKRDLQLLLSSPRAGVESLSDRLSQFDRSTLIALLSQREDISEAEANRIVDQIESVRDSIGAQFQQIQQKLREITEGTFGKIREYLNSLERPELNYDQIQQDFAKLFDDPQAGLAALRDRLSQFDRNTLVALLSSRPDISPTQANQIINRIESARDKVLSQAERIQQETQKRLRAIQQQVKQQAIDSRKAATDAAWWLFNAAFCSLVASAIAGAIAVNTPNPWI